MLIFSKIIYISFDGKSSTKIDESENFLKVDNRYVLERPLTRQFWSKSENSSVFSILKFGFFENEEP